MQLQRKLENATKHTSDRLNIATAAGDEQMVNQERLRLTQLTQKYKEVSDKAGLPYRAERLRSVQLTGGGGGGRINIPTKRLNPLLPPPMDKERYLRMKAALEKQGVSVRCAKGDELGYLDWLGAEATAPGPNVILHRGEIPSASAMFEEVIHNRQIRKYGEFDGSNYLVLFSREIEANRKLLRNANAYGFAQQDIDDTIRNLGVWEKGYEQLTGQKYD